MDKLKIDWKKALSDTDPQVVRVAINNISDQTTLKEVVKTHTDTEVRCSAVHRLTDPETIDKLCYEIKNIKVLYQLGQKTTSQTVFKYLLDCKCDGVRRMAITRITDPITIKEAVNNSDIGVVLSAIDKITDPIFLENLNISQQIHKYKIQQTIQDRLEYLNNVVNSTSNNTSNFGTINIDILSLKEKIIQRYTLK